MTASNKEILQSTGGRPEIMAPAGDTECFLAALAAGANGIYAGLKNFSARMQAHNFGLGELARLTLLAHAAHCKVYAAMNNLLKQSELTQAWRLIKRIKEQTEIDGIIIQDLGMLNLAQQAGFKGEIIFSTLANITSPDGLETAKKTGASRVVLPRELSVDEMRIMGNSCPPGMNLECFVHGALCYCVSGRCYWSSYMGGYSGLRGRCVQPCRRNYSRCKETGRKNQPKGKRLFACQDLELAPALKALFSVPHLASWKIEGRKKGAHYVYYTVTAYKILRDEFQTASQKKLAFEILNMALGRPGVRARFLSQKNSLPVNPDKQTSSGKLIGKIHILQSGKCIIKAHMPLLPNDLLRIGVQDENWHSLFKVKRGIPQGGELPLTLPKHKTPKTGTPVFLIDRREQELEKILKEWQKKLAAIEPVHILDIDSLPDLSKTRIKAVNIPDMEVNERFTSGQMKIVPGLAKNAIQGIWLNRSILRIPPRIISTLAFWLPPVIWPEEETGIRELLTYLLNKNAVYFILNSPWQRSLFPERLGQSKLIAGPFCNIANSLACEKLIQLGFSGAFISPELAEEDFLKLPPATSLPLGIVLGGFWPVGISRFGLAGITAQESFTSPQGEKFWLKDRGNMIWIFPAWQLNLAEKKNELQKSGYKFFCWLNEQFPVSFTPQKRPGLFNWNGKYL